MATIRNTIESSLRLMGQLAEGESMSPATAQDALTAFNQMIDGWSTERLSVYTTQDQVFNWPPNLATRTLGPSGNFIGLRPVLVDDSTYYKDANGLSFTPMIVNEDQYNAIALKSVTSTYPQVMWVNMGMPDISITVYPVPTTVLEWHIISVKVLTQATNLSDVLIIPPGYLRAFNFNLTVEFCNQFGVEPMPRTLKIADNAKRDIKRINDPGDLMAMPYPLIARNQRFNIFTNSMG